ncbi:MAG: hypothetical protein CMI09_05120 [Oceanospirillaceae bacterium]|nr:hypothetical protein [Oceanospirillaceae bacterium]
MRTGVAEGSTNVQYQLELADTRDPKQRRFQPLNAYLNGHIEIEWSGLVFCQHCNRKSRKSYGQGYCYPCFTRLAQCDTCMMSPERCHFHQGTCREPSWAEQVCFQPHLVYLSNTSGLKVGITRSTQLPTRWIDQGAAQAVVLAQVSSRRLSGLIEDRIREQMSDKTNWRQLLKSEPPELDLVDIRNSLIQQLKPELLGIAEPFGPDALFFPENGGTRAFQYPVLSYPTKVSSFNLDKTPKIGGRLMGIKGQYLLLDGGVINLRRFSGYEVSLNLQPNETEY